MQTSYAKQESNVCETRLILIATRHLANERKSRCDALPFNIEMPFFFLLTQSIKSYGMCETNYPLCHSRFLNCDGGDDDYDDGGDKCYTPSIIDTVSNVIGNLLLASNRFDYTSVDSPS